MNKGLREDGAVFHAGFPNAAEDARFGSLSLDSLVAQHRASTFFWRLDSDIEELQWRKGSIVVVDRAIDAKEGNNVIVILDSDFVIARCHQKRFYRLDGTILEGEVAVWGVATYIIQPLVGKA